MKPRVRLFNDPRKALVTVAGHTTVAHYDPRFYAREAAFGHDAVVSAKSLEASVRLCIEMIPYWFNLKGTAHEPA